MAWLTAKPAPEKKALSHAPEVSRYDQIRADGLTPELPPAGALYLVDWLFEIGPSVPAGMGSGAIGWRDIAAWQEVGGIELLPWEARILRRISGEYVAETRRAEKPDCPAPWVAMPDGVRRENVSRKVGNILGGIAAQSKGKAHEGRNA